MFYFNSRDELYKKPFGAVKSGCELTFTVYGGDELTAPYLCIKSDKKDEELIQLRETYIDGAKYYTLKYTFWDCGLYFYCFRFNPFNTSGLYNKGNGTTEYADSGKWFMQTIYDERFSTPDRFKGGIVYQIFPDRFNEGRKKENNLSFPDRHYRSDKDGQPFYKWSRNGKQNVGTDYFGGDLLGITEKADYLESLGVSCIYLNPIFESHENHHYNTANYMKVDPDLGTTEDFVHMCDVLHSKGIKVVLDGVFSHTGSDSIYFNKEGRYGDGGAYRDENSPYREWYDFGKHYRNGYRAWWDFPALPDVDELIPSYVQFICGEGGVIDHWLKLGADGFRLDVADELPDEFIEYVRQAVKRNGEDKLLIGEVWEDAITKESYGNRRTYLLGKGLDSTMNYPFRDAVLDFIKYGNGLKFCESIYSIYENYPREAMDNAWNNLSTHDVLRAITFLRGEEDTGDREWESKHFLSDAQFEKGKKMLLCAYALCYALPGVPSLYYGDEIGMQGYKDPFNRGYYQWQNQDTELLSSMQNLAKFRKKHRQRYSTGGIYFVHVSDDCVAFSRFQGYDEVLTCVNRGDKFITFSYRGNEISIPPMSYKNLEI